MGKLLKTEPMVTGGIDPNFQIRMPNYDLTGPTNLQTTVEDLIKWDRNFDSKIVGGDAALTAMQTPVAHSGIYGLGLYVHSRETDVWSSSMTGGMPDIARILFAGPLRS